MIIPSKLRIGDRVAIVSPSGSIDINYLNNAVNILELWGLKPYVSACAGGKHHVFSGTKEERLMDLQQALDDIDCRAIFCARGGYGAIQLVEDLQAKNFIDSPKWLIGFSDITVLHAWAGHHGVASLHAQMPKNFPFGEEDNSLISLKNYLFDGELEYLWNGSWEGAETAIKGEIIGGNLSVFAGLTGSIYEPDLKNKILFIEDLNEHLYHLDRLMFNLKLRGAFNSIKALLVGTFSDMKDSDPPFGENVKSIILNATKSAGIPVIFDVPAGHVKPNLAIPLGVKLMLEKQGDAIKMSSI